MIGRKDNNVINTAYRFRLFPDEHQEQLIGRNLGACRWLYNRMLSDWTETYRQSGISEKAYACVVQASPSVLRLAEEGGFSGISQCAAES